MNEHNISADANFTSLYLQAEMLNFEDKDIGGLEAIFRAVQKRKEPFIEQAVQNFQNNKPIYTKEDIEKEFGEAIAPDAMNLTDCCRHYNLTRTNGTKPQEIHLLRTLSIAQALGVPLREQQITLAHDIKEDVITSYHDLLTAQIVGKIGKHCQVADDISYETNLLTNGLTLPLKTIRNSIGEKNEQGIYIIEQSTSFNDIHSILNTLEEEILYTAIPETLKQEGTYYEQINLENLDFLRKEFQQGEQIGWDAATTYTNLRITPNSYFIYLSNLEQGTKQPAPGITKTHAELINSTNLVKELDKWDDMYDRTGSLKHGVRSVIKTILVAEQGLRHINNLTPESIFMVFANIETAHRYAHSPEMFNMEARTEQEKDKIPLYKRRLLESRVKSTIYMKNYVNPFKEKLLEHIKKEEPNIIQRMDENTTKSLVDYQ